MNTKPDLSPLSAEELAAGMAASENTKTKKEEWMVMETVPDSAAPLPDTHYELGMPQTRFCYKNAEGEEIFYICRFESPDGKKELRPLSYCRNAQGEEQWRWKQPNTPYPMYHFDMLHTNLQATVLVCEGEKTADAASDLFPDYISTTSPFGAGSAKKANWNSLRGRNVVIWPDNDDAGKLYAEDVGMHAWKAGALSVKIVQVPDNFPPKWDLADECPAGADLRALLNTATPISRPPSYISRGDFKMSETGLTYDPRDSKDGPEFVCSSLEVLAQTCDENNEMWGLLLRWGDRGGHVHKQILRLDLLAGNPTDLIKFFLNGGLNVNNTQRGSKLLSIYLNSVRPEMFAISVDSVGWHGKIYVSPKRSYGDDGKAYFLKSEAPVAEQSVSGSVEEWQSEIACFAISNSRLALSICASFAAPLLKLVDSENFGFHIVGGSSSGKSTALRCGASVAGSDMGSWRMTSNAGEGIACGLNDGLMTLDEVSEANGLDVDELTYMFGNGSGKSRMRKDATNKKVLKFRNIILSSGEVKIADKVAGVGRKYRPGQAVRMIDIPADAGKNFKLFETLHGFPSGQALAEHLNAACKKFHGIIMERYLEAVASDPDGVADMIRTRMKRWQDENTTAGMDGQVCRVAGHFALLAAAGEYAISLGLLPWPVGEAERACKVCFDAWLDERGSIRSLEDEDVIRQIALFIENNGSARFAYAYKSGNALKTDDLITPGQVGFRYKDENGNWQYLVSSESWGSILCKGFSERDVNKRLMKLGLLRTNGKSPSVLKYINGDRRRLYQPDVILMEAILHPSNDNKPELVTDQAA